jgi:tRNA (cytidine56-2'-O)-methyltransferase
MFLVGRDPEIVAGVDDVVRRFGGDFHVEEVDGWRAVITRFKKQGSVVVHLTMYGEHLDDVQDVLRRKAKDHGMLIVVGAEMVSFEVYRNADFNVAVANQPHSEVAALAIFLDRMQESNSLKHDFSGGSVRILPNPRGKTVEDDDGNGSEGF